MTEEKWLSGQYSPYEMLQYLCATTNRPHPDRDRKLRIFLKRFDEQLLKEFGIHRESRIHPITEYAKYVAQSIPLVMHPYVIELIYELWGNPFREYKLEVSSTSKEIASKIYKEERYQDTIILRESLIDNGCTEDYLLNHLIKDCHIQGCWAIDLILDLK